MPQTHAITREKLVLPPPFTAVCLRERDNAFAHAKSIAAEQGAGTLVHVARADLIEFALVLEPEEPLGSARRAFYAGMISLADALIGTSEGEIALGIDWPDAIRINAGLVGGGRLAWPAGVGEGEVPPWLVFGVMIRMQSMAGQEPGLNPQVTTLVEEGFVSDSDEAILKSFARHFMLALDTWQDRGFGALVKDYWQWLGDDKGTSCVIDDNGNLLQRCAGSNVVECRSLAPALATPSWLDTATGEVRA